MQNVNELLTLLNSLNREGDKQSEAAMKVSVVALQMSVEEKVGTRAEIKAFEEEVSKKISKVKNDYMLSVNVKKHELWNDIRGMVNQEEGVEKNPKVETCWTKAWEEGHSAGYSEIVSCFRNLVDLIK
jgi:hypothetical protein